MAELSTPVIQHKVLVVSSAGASASYSGLRLLMIQKSRDYIHGGAGVITGTVKIDTTPVDIPLRRRVRLHREVDGMLVRETWSDEGAGAYTFTDINPAYTYTVIAYDYAHDYRAVVADNLTPEVLP